jgi:hypothetical protein
MSQGWQEIPLPDGMSPKLLVWRWFAKTYHWTPDQVEEAPLEVQTWFPLIEEAFHKAQEEFAKAEARMARNPARR